MLVRLGPPARARLALQIVRAVEVAAAVVRRAVPWLSVAVVGDRRMRRLNRDFHAADRTTDVLAFPLGWRGAAVEGEVIACAPYARREAVSRGLDPRGELLLYVVHGTLHLLGEDDHDPDDARRMRALERAALRRLGYRLPASHLDENKGE